MARTKNPKNSILCGSPNTFISTRLPGLTTRAISLMPFGMSGNQIRRHRQQLEIVAAQSGRLIGCRERAVGIAPGAPPVMLAALFKVAKHGPISDARIALIEVAHQVVQSGGCLTDLERNQPVCSAARLVRQAPGVGGGGRAGARRRSPC